MSGVDVLSPMRKTSHWQGAYSWLKENIENVVVVHCKAGMARTGLMISSLLLYLKFFPTGEESINYYNQKRCVDGKGLVLPSACFEDSGFIAALIGLGPPSPSLIIMVFSSQQRVIRPPRIDRMLSSQPEDFWFSAPKKGIMVFALPGEPDLTELAGDFKIHFHDRQGDFYCWLNTTVIDNRKVLNTGELEWFDKRKLPSPGFQVEVVLVDYNSTVPTMPQTETSTSKPDESSGTGGAAIDRGAAPANENKDSGHNDKDDVFSDGEAEQSDSSKSVQNKAASAEGVAAHSATSKSETNTKSDQVASLVHSTEQVSLGSGNSQQMHATGEPNKAAIGDTQVSSSESEFRAMAADAFFLASETMKTMKASKAGQNVLDAEYLYIKPACKLYASVINSFAASFVSCIIRIWFCLLVCIFKKSIVQQ
ncbi:cysteine proteinase RD21a-like [Hibiscus syriacus]|uniref:Cysteine proteinase RD21a-like n=1 Tax=Hibiscus syriacus TaxID=106335 RepID=A0A6A3ATK3_HIBSY|nr:cysteine proteinase RD21a-like [Hibiscus syriacus]